MADPVRRAWVAMSDDTFAPLSPAKGRGRASKGIGAAPTSQARTMGRQRATQTGWLFLHQNWQGVEMQAQTNCLPTLDVQLASAASCQLCCRLHGSSSHLSAVWCGQNQNFSGLSSAAASDGKPSGVALRLPANLTAQTKICSAAAWHTHGQRRLSADMLQLQQGKRPHAQLTSSAAQPPQRAMAAAPTTEIPLPGSASAHCGADSKSSRPGLCVAALATCARLTGRCRQACCRLTAMLGWFSGPVMTASGTSLMPSAMGVSTTYECPRQQASV